MFTIIESNASSSYQPKSHEHHKSEIKTLLQLLKSYQRFELPEEERPKASFLIADNRKNGIYGGALLYPQSITSTDFLSTFTSSTKQDNLLYSIENIFSLFGTEVENIWAARVCLRVSDKTFPLTSELFEYHESFYEELFKYFCTFGKREGVEHLALTLQARDHNNTKTYGWPYVFEITSKESIDRLFHGFLALQTLPDLRYQQSPYPYFPAEAANSQHLIDRPVL
ncbi:MAG: hypothetical protein KBD90_06700 [Alphaproteobacteria bacterium]|jgi:hypothetical protein|nr:hypothetical protein [Alphaproteobacteria bacterium]